MVLKSCKLKTPSLNGLLGDTLARQLTQYDLTGITPEELQKKTVADITKQNLDIIFIGINPGYHSALTGHHYSGSGTFYCP